MKKYNLYTYKTRQNLDKYHSKSIIQHYCMQPKNLLRLCASIKLCWQIRQVTYNSSKCDKSYSRCHPIQNVSYTCRTNIYPCAIMNHDKLSTQFNNSTTQYNITWWMHLHTKNRTLRYSLLSIIPRIHIGKILLWFNGMQQEAGTTIVAYTNYCINYNYHGQWSHNWWIFLANPSSLCPVCNLLTEFCSHLMNILKSYLLVSQEWPAIALIHWNRNKLKIEKK